MIESDGATFRASDCIFCKIIAKEVPASIILETGSHLVFSSLDGGYPLIVPRNHYKNLLDPGITVDIAREMGELQLLLSRAVKDAFQAGGVTVAINNGRASGQEINHLHSHIIPRFTRDRLVDFKRTGELPISELDRRASLVRERLVGFQELNHYFLL